ncbi:Hypothetical protein I5071_86430 [Sandaracinus amylolyticus]|nr:Hypothetical protein I5071_86430 [Sandaracinus amylolyticus]
MVRHRNISRSSARLQGSLQGVSFARGLVQMHEVHGVGSIERISIEGVESWRAVHGGATPAGLSTGVSFPCPSDSLGTILPSGVDRAAGYPQNGLGGAKPAPLFLRASGLRCLEAHT